MDIKELRDKITGGYAGKPQLLDVVRKYQLGLKMIAYIHYRGTKKYPAFGWYNEPLDCGGSISDDLNALVRHFGAHSSGFMCDPEGSPHIFHMCCRAGMTVSLFYQSVNRHTWHMEGTTEGNYDAQQWAKFITNEEILSLTKTPALKAHTLLELQSDILPAILNAESYIKLADYDTKNFFSYEHPTPLDTLFKLVLTYAQIFWTVYGTQAFFPEELLKEDAAWISMFCDDRNEFIHLIKLESELKALSQPSEKVKAPIDR